MVNSLSLENTGIVQSLLRCCKSTSIVLASINGFLVSEINFYLMLILTLITVYTGISYFFEKSEYPTNIKLN